MTEVINPILVQDPRPVVPEVPHLGDPFMEMLYVIYEVMPNALAAKEWDLNSLSIGLERLSDYQNDLSAAQNIFNELKEYADRPAAEADPLVQKMLTTIDQLVEDIENEDIIDDTGGDTSLKAQVLDSLTRFTEDARASPRGPAEYFVNMYYGASMKEGGVAREDFKKRLDDLNIAGTTFRSTSAQTQTAFDLDTQDYNAWVGLVKNMFESVFDQVGAPIRESINTK